MSRTYRKNPRRFYKHQGTFYSTHEDRTIKGKASNYKKHDWIKHLGTYTYYGMNHFYEEVTVCESEAYPRYRCPWDVKRRCRRIDRARYKDALLKDDNITPAFNPWDWD